MPTLAGFSSVRPRYEVTQGESLRWLANAHATAEATAAGLDAAARHRFEDRLARVLARCACPPGKIDRRSLVIGELASARWTDNTLYDLEAHPHGATIDVRTRVFGDVVDAYFASAYAGDVEPPDELVHVTCTGYLSPSGAQKLVARRRWPTRVTHAYHMGCYAAIPALRIAAGFAATGARRVDLVHTELCTLHLDPLNHAIDQLVVQSLFADGMIRYSLVDDVAPGLRVRAVHEVVVPDTEDAMTWTVGPWGMVMTLARDVPERIAGALRGFVGELYDRAGLDLGALRDSCFAVHPGGPRIIDRVRDVLELDERQLAASRGVLRERGNMSSATLPHIWERVLADPGVPSGTLVPSLAFGPGLSVCGALLEKR